MDIPSVRTCRWIQDLPSCLWIEILTNWIDYDLLTLQNFDSVICNKTQRSIFLSWRLVFSELSSQTFKGKLEWLYKRCYGTKILKICQSPSQLFSATSLSRWMHLNIVSNSIEEIYFYVHGNSNLSGLQHFFHLPHPNLKTIKFKSDDELNELIFDSNHFLPQLQKLSWHEGNYEVFKTSWDHANSIVQFGHLTTLEFCEIQLNEIDVIELLERIPTLQNLRLLQIEYDQLIEDSNLDEWNQQSKFNSLESLVFGSDIQNKIIEYFTPPSTHIPNSNDYPYPECRSQLLAAIAIRSPNLKKCYVDSFHYNQISIHNVATGCPDLEEFQFASSYTYFIPPHLDLFDFCFQGFQSLIDNAKHLKTLKLLFGEEYGFNVFVRLPYIDTQHGQQFLNNMQCIELENVGVYTSSDSLLIRQMFVSSNLEELSLTLQMRDPLFFRNTFDIFSSDQQIIHSHSKLKKLHFSTALEENFQMRPLIEALSRFCPNLESLSLEVEDITEIGLRGILETFYRSLKKLVCFRRNDEDFDWGNAEYRFPSLFSQCSKLEEFCITNVNETELSSFTLAITAAPSLRKLTCVLEEGEQLLREYFEVHQIPKKLFIDTTRLMMSDVENFMSAFP
jgi:hypothetical protein